MVVDEDEFIVKILTNPLHHYLGKPFEPEVLMALLKRIGL